LLSDLGLIDCLAVGEWAGFVVHLSVGRAGFVVHLSVGASFAVHLLVRRAGFVVGLLVDIRIDSLNPPLQIP